MIKYYCDKCNEEISLPVNVVQDYHLCDECMALYKECEARLNSINAFLGNYNFQIGDEVIMADGRTGTIESICDCEQCEERGFYEPTAKLNSGDTEWITKTDKDLDFHRFYKIGNYVFGNLYEEDVRSDIISKEKELEELKIRFKLIEKLKNGTK